MDSHRTAKDEAILTSVAESIGATLGTSLRGWVRAKGVNREGCRSQTAGSPRGKSGEGGCEEVRTCAGTCS